MDVIMNKAVIYYFSGTGNSLYLAKVLAENLGDHLVPIVSTMRVEAIRPEASVVGIVYPVCFNDLPVLVGELLVICAVLRIRMFSPCAITAAAAANRLKRSWKSSEQPEVS
jgi:hypothetical protein